MLKSREPSGYSGEQRRSAMTGYSNCSCSYIQRFCNRDDLFWAIIFIVVLSMWLPTFWRSLHGQYVGGYAYGELLINWSGGFVRRGLYGTLAVEFHSLTGKGVVLVTALIFILLTLIQISALFYLLRQYKNDYLLIILIALSPTMLLFAVYDWAAYWRKEFFLFVAILLHALIAQRYLTGLTSFNSYKKVFLFGCIPLLIINTLIYEVQGLFLTFHIAITLSVYRNHILSDHSSVKDDDPMWILVVWYLVVLIPFFASILAHGDKQQSVIMFDSIKNWSGATPDAIFFHSLTLAESERMARQILSDPASFLTYLGAFLLGPVMLGMLIRSRIQYRHSVVWVWPFIPSMGLFLIGWDWGRWINMIAVTGVAYTLHIPCQTKFPSIDRDMDRFPSHWIQSFLLISFVAFYTVGWHLPHYGPRPDLLYGRFVDVWLELRKGFTILIGAAN